MLLLLLLLLTRGSGLAGIFRFVYKKNFAETFSILASFFALLWEALPMIIWWHCINFFSF